MIFAATAVGAKELSETISYEKEHNKQLLHRAEIMFMTRYGYLFTQHLNGNLI